jgi:hypothetical protein
VVHSDSHAAAEELQQRDVLIVTHQAFINAKRSLKVPSGKWLELGVGAFSGNMKISFQAARSIG